MCDTVDTAGIDARLDRIGAHHFRARFHLRYGRDRALVELRGMETVRRHADEITGKRLAPAAPEKKFAKKSDFLSTSRRKSRLVTHAPHCLFCLP